MEVFLFAVLFVAVAALAVSLALNSAASKRAKAARKKREYTQEELYDEIVSLVAAEKYQQAFDLWKQYASDARFSLGYKDLADHFHYATALKGYVGVPGVFLHDVKAALEKVSPGFHKVADYLREVTELCETVCGVYTKEAEAAAEYRMEIAADGTADIRYEQPQNYITVSYIKGSKVAWTIENGSVSAGKVSGGPYFLKLIPCLGGMEVEDRRRYGNDLEMCGSYVRQS